MRNDSVTQWRAVAHITFGDMLPVRAAELRTCVHSLKMVAHSGIRTPMRDIGLR
jgi:hypothetical protein